MWVNFSIYTDLIINIFMDLLIHVYTYVKKNEIEKKVLNFEKFFLFIFSVLVQKKNYTVCWK